MNNSRHWQNGKMEKERYSYLLAGTASYRKNFARLQQSLARNTHALTHCGVQSAPKREGAR